MYFPYFRGKQYELITIRENAELLAEAEFVPIIEPVRGSLNGLQRTLQAVSDAGGRAIVIVNPFHGHFANGGDPLSDFLNAEFEDEGNISPAILLKEQTTVGGALDCYAQHEEADITLIHSGFTAGQALSNQLGAAVQDMRHVFLDEYSGRLYRRHFQAEERVLVRDGFQRRRNRDYPDVEFFSDLHITYAEEGMTGFGDFLTVGDEYSESGGPAYAVAIHLTFINPAADDAMYIYHFKSQRQDTPTDPAGKFGEALALMIDELDRPNCPVLETRAVMEFRELHERGHFPGLGYVKKLSMQHHIETLADFFD